MEGQEVQKNDTIEMKYTGWLHAGNAFGKVRNEKCISLNNPTMKKILFDCFTILIYYFETEDYFRNKKYIL